MITASISAQSWDTVGGRGGIQPFEASMSLAVSQTEEVHKFLEDLLDQIRRVTPQVADATNEQAKIEESKEPILRVYTLYDARSQDTKRLAHSWNGNECRRRRKLNQRRL